MKTIQFFATLGFVAGYFHENQSHEAQPVNEVARIWQQKAAEVYAESQIYIGAVCSLSQTVYHQDWGCPEGGEITVSITGTCNPLYTSTEHYKATTEEVLKRCALALQQSTAQVTFIEVDFTYLDFR
ncbi:MAG: hypothetical protein ACKVTZ_16475 [Bacteroidia bacterium]